MDWEISLSLNLTYLFVAYFDVVAISYGRFLWLFDSSQSSSSGLSAPWAFISYSLCPFDYQPELIWDTITFLKTFLRIGFYSFSPVEVFGTQEFQSVTISLPCGSSLGFVSSEIYFLSLRSQLLADSLNCLLAGWSEKRSIKHFSFLASFPKPPFRKCPCTYVFAEWEQKKCTGYEIVSFEMRQSAVRIYFRIVRLKGAYDKFPDIFRMDTFIDSTHMNI